ncbi:MAG: universal stress protein, partial [Candidatus Tectomicrobia bacterium]|nr:universal stress protein [Candidatus Tectomicrobia bacterium]
DVVNVIEGEAYAERLSKAYLDKIVDEIKEPGIKKKRSVILRGKAADQILDYAERNKIDIIAAASHGHSGIRRWVIGSTIDKILRGAKSPVLLVHSKEKPGAYRQTAAFTHVLLPLDGSKAAEAALPYTESIVNKAKVRVSLLRAVSPLVDQYAGPPEGYVVDYTGKVMQALEEEAVDYLKQTAKIFEERGILVSTTMIIGSPATEILKYIEKQKVDLVVMSSHGRTGFGRWILGSVADKVLHSVEIPLLLIRPS